MENIPHFLSTYGYLGIFLLLMVGIVGLPIPDEVVLMFAGYLIFKGYFHPLPTVAAALLGTFCGITVSYSLGRSAGFYLLQRYGHVLRVSPEKIDGVAHRRQAQERFQVVAVSRSQARLHPGRQGGGGGDRKSVV